MTPSHAAGEGKEEPLRRTPTTLSSSNDLAPRVARLLLVGLLGIVACTGPESGDDQDPTPTATSTATATMTPSPTATQPPASPTTAASPTPESTATPAASPTVAASPTAAASPTTASIEDLRTELPQLAELPGQGYIIAEEGTRTAQELAAAYADPAAHLRRLEEWGFKRHGFRGFTREPSGANDPLPPTLLATINEYGSPEQAEQALQWLLRLGTSAGATQVDAPRVGDNAVAITLPTRDNVPTASVYVRRAQYVYVYFAEGGDALAAVMGIAERVFDR